MEVILLQDIKSLGKAGQVKTISDGYARNYLLPNKLAVFATTSQKNQLNQQKKVKHDQEVTKEKELHDVIQRIQNVSLQFSEKVSETGTLFKGITRETVADELSKAVQYTIKPESIIMDKPIKHSGEITVDITLNKINYPVRIIVNK
jgi:large subunit ribosomal protein L9